MAASAYDSWYWKDFWNMNEVPLVARAIGRSEGRRRALDAGTGTGQYLSLLVARSYRAVGLDLSPAMIAEGKRTLGANAHMVCGSIEQCPFAVATFDLVVACRVLSHVADLEVAFAELARVTLSSAQLIVSDVSPSHNYVSTRIPTPEGDVHIETYKRSSQEVVSAAVASGSWVLDFVREVHYDDLIMKPTSEEFPSIDINSKGPIFFYSRLRRRPRST